MKFLDTILKSKDSFEKEGIEKLDKLEKDDDMNALNE